MMEEKKLKDIENITNVFMQLDYARTPSSTIILEVSQATIPIGFK